MKLSNLKQMPNDYNFSIRQDSKWKLYIDTYM